MHAHTAEVSDCGTVGAAEIVRLYHEKGYSGLVVTDHFSSSAHKYTGIKSWNKYIDYFLNGYNIAKKAAPDGFTVLLGLEIRFPKNTNDYLVYGVSKQLLYENPFMFETKPRDFKSFCEKNGLIFFQAHPFRTHMTVVNPQYLHGIETLNYNQRHDSRNDIAGMWARKFGLLTLSGSDFHQLEDLALGGIYFDKKITSPPQLVELLRAGNYKLKESYDHFIDKDTTQEKLKP